MRNEKSNANRVIVRKIIGYCDTIENLRDEFGDTFENYISSVAFQLSCGMCIIHIGELTTRLTEDFKAQNSEIPWSKIKALRNIHAHDYEKINFEILWKILTEEIPALKESLLKIE